MNIITYPPGPQLEPVTLVQGTSEKKSPLQHYLGIAIRRRWVIIGAVAACLLLGLIATLLMTPKYTATATIEIAREADQVTNFQGVERDVSIADQEFYQTQYGLLQSRSLAERIAEQLRLTNNPDFFEMFGEMRDEPAFQLANGRFPAAGRDERRRVAGEILLNHVSINPTRLSRLVAIQFTSPDPQFSAKIVNAWGENFIQTNLERKVQATSYGRDVLQRQLAEYKERLDESQRQLVAYASQEQIINLPSAPGDGAGQTQQRSILADNLASLNDALSEAIADRIQAEARYRQAGPAGASTLALSNQAINALRQRRAELAAEYEQLMVRFEPGYPAAQAIQSQIDQLDRSISREEARISGSQRAEYRQSVQRENALRSQVNELKADFIDLQRRSIQYNIYQQEVDTNRALYDGLLQRFKEIGVAGGVGVNNIAIVDTADPPRKPSSPRPILNILASLLAGLVIGAALAFGLEQLDETIADPAEVEKRLGLPLLGTVPQVEDESPHSALLDRKSDLFDAYLAIQTSLGFTTEHGVPKTLAVTSTRPAEGKSTTALALSTTLARGGRSVVLVDGDMRSPSVHQLAGLDHTHGLSNFLSGDEDVASMLIELPDLGIHIVTAGPVPPNAAELLTGTRLSVLIERLRESFDHVIIDSPPVMGLADAPLIASRVEGLIFVVESHGIRTGQVKTALGRLASASGHILGGVLTKFQSRKAGYGYGYDYGYTYGRERNEGSTV